MEEVNFKKSGFWYNLMRFSYVESLPSNTCAYKRRLILSAFIAVLLLPLTLLRLIYRGFTVITDKYFAGVVNGVNGYGNSVLFIFLPYVFSIPFVKMFPRFLTESSMDISMWLWGVVTMVCVLVCIILFVLLIYGIIKLAKLFKSTDTNGEGEPTSTVGVLYKSWKDKYCKKIKWE